MLMFFSVAAFAEENDSVSPVSIPESSVPSEESTPSGRNVNIDVEIMYGQYNLSLIHI